MVNDKFIAERIRELRKERGLDAEKFGEKVGRSGKTVSAWETGRNTPSAEMLINICRVYSVDIDYFYPDDVTKTKNGTISTFSDEEELVEIYRSLNSDGKNHLLVYARGCAASFK